MSKPSKERADDISFVAINSIVSLEGIENERRKFIWESVLKELE